MHAVSESSLEPIAIDEGHKELEVFLLAVVRRCGHQEEMTRES